jgi:prepilin-type N-terminal cleavage/methylation domain-containing protein
LFIKLPEDESGYSLVEVMASIMILAIAIIPMVGMFDTGLKAANRSGNYDKARAFANEQLERVKAMSYAHVRSNFPVASSTPDKTGNHTSSAQTVPADVGLPAGSTYTVVKQYVYVDSNTSPPSLADAATDSRMIRVTVTVDWSGNSYTASGVVAGGLA